MLIYVEIDHIVLKDIDLDPMNGALNIETE